ncbi:LysR family transcriptional regulator [Polaromonas sp. CG_9.11]|uniref:LysR family transcriptional regulator n=1 Tax=Polaromonas sp. CG_9.11 TaxID=2787730 RepID=UPI0018C99105|nr:LysR family transcriptional regulator [Polaromonas sp. CG_9.11]MBG6078211.1 DNA-binding transcriptional LysR family regulator [Polaromonas sp. CG_9.11]
MNAQMQYKIEASDLGVVLALVRAGTLADAGERLGVDASTVFRTVQRIEKGLRIRLFERSRSGYLPTELAQELSAHGEQMEAQLEAARSAAQISPGQVSGTVRVTSTDTIMHGLIAPALKQLLLSHPLLSFDLHTGNELANLTRRDADIAVRATRGPPQHLVGKHIGPIRVALYGSKKDGPKNFDAEVAARTPWAAPDDALPEHPSVVWRKKHFPKVIPAYRVGSILTVSELVGQGAAIGLLPVFLARDRSELTQLTDVLDECQTELWLLTHTDARHLRRVAAVYSCLLENLKLT